MASSVTAPQGDALRSTANFELLIAGIRGGKTHTGALKTILRALAMPCAEDECHLVVSPTYKMSKVPVEKLMKLFFDQSLFPQNPLRYYAKSERCFYLEANGGVSRIQVFSGHDPDSMRGIKALSAWLDEAAYLSDAAWEVVQGRLADSNGPVTITTTPNGHNWVYDLSQKATETAAERQTYSYKRSPDNNVIVVQFGSRLNTFIKNQTRFDQLKESYDADTYAQEVMAQFVARSGRVYKSFDREKHLVTRQLNPGAKVYVGQDFNVDPLCSIVLQDTDGKGLHAFEEFTLRDSDTYRLVAHLRQWAAKRNVPQSNIVIMPDASGRKRSTAASDTASSDLQILRQAGFKIEAPRSNPAIKDRVNAVNGLFANNRLTVEPGCKELIAALESQAWNTDVSPVVPDKDGWADNYIDALGYAVWGKYPLRRETSMGLAA